MRTFYQTLLCICLALGLSTMAQGQIVIEEQNFNSLSDAGTACSDMLADGGFLTNSGASNVGTGLSDFQSRWFTNGNASGSVGPVTATNDSGDFIGVNSFSASNAPTTSPDGTPVASGTEHNFQFNDVDGIVVTAFETVDVSGVSNRRLKFYYWLNNTGYETDDQFKATILGQGVGGTAIVNVSGDDLETTTDTWIEVDIDLEPIIAVQGENLLLQFEVSNNSSSENIFVDDIQFYYEEDVVGGPGCEELFFSEYIEGSSNNKCLEIYNPTPNPVDLDEEYYILRYSNGNTSSTFIGLSGTIAPYGVHVICNPSATADFLAQADETSGNISHNGNDSYELVRIETVIDAIGQVGNSSNFAVDVTLVRKPGITSGDSNSGDAFDPTIEWNSFPSNTSSELGSHTSDCAPVAACQITNVTITDAGTCNDAESPYVNDDTATISVEVCFENIPEGGNLVVAVDESQSEISVDNIFQSEEDCAELSVTIPADGQSYLVDAFFSADPTCNGMASGIAPEPCSDLTPCDFLFFSEYVEGSGNNKCLEIYNPTDYDVDLSSFGVFLSFNGGSFETTVPLNGVVASGDVYVICNNQASAEFQAVADELTSEINFNGDDAVLLEDANGVIDAIGQRGVDPGSEWNSNGVGTRDETLQRMFWVQNGDNNPNDAFDPSAEWMTFPQNTSFGLGYHGSPCQPSLPPGFNPVGIGCNDFALDITETDFDINTPCTPTNIFQDQQVFVFQEACGMNSSVTSDVAVTPAGFAGVSYRASLLDNSARIMLYTKSNNRVYWSVRSTTGSFAITNNTFAFGLKALRIVRMGNLYRGYVSSDGINFVQRFQAVVNLGDCPLAGAFTHSYVNTVVSTGTFSNLVVTDGAMLQIANEEAALEVAELAVSPNPASEWLSVAWPTNYSGEGQLEVRDLNGRLLQNLKVDLDNGSQHVLLPNDMSAGIYLLSLHTDNEILTKRFVKAD